MYFDFVATHKEFLSILATSSVQHKDRTVIKIHNYLLIPLLQLFSVILKMYDSFHLTWTLTVNAVAKKQKQQQVSLLVIFLYGGKVRVSLIQKVEN